MRSVGGSATMSANVWSGSQPWPTVFPRNRWATPWDSSDTDLSVADLASFSAYSTGSPALSSSAWAS